MQNKKKRTGKATGGTSRKNLSALQTANSKVILAVIADVHASLTPPVFRSSEPDWLEAQARPWREIRLLCRRHKCPLAICGDLFDRWDARPEVVNWLMGVLPRKQKVYAVPGNHDLAYHNYDDIHRSAYWTLVQAGRIINVPYRKPIVHNDSLVLHGFPCGEGVDPYELTPKDKKQWPTTAKHIALIHRYVWVEGLSFPGVSEKDRADNVLNEFRGFDLVASGDHHNGFLFQGKT